MWRPSSEAQWKPDAAVEEARLLPGWREFHRVCGRRGFYFDRPVRRGRRYAVDCFETGRLIVTGDGATVVEAIGDALERCGRADGETRKWFAEMTDDDDFERLLRD